MAKYKIHPYCERFPEISGEEREQVKADIAAHGLRNPIYVWGNQIVDGKNRYEICEELGIVPETREWRPSAKARDGKQQDAELWAFVVSQNLSRRHLTASQRALIAAQSANETVGGDRKSHSANLRNGEKTSHEKAAETLGVSPRSVESAAKVIESAAAPVVKAVEAGEVTVSDAAKIADLPKDEQRAALRKVESGEAKTLSAAAKKPRRAKKQDESSHLDHFKYAVPESLSEVFAQCEEFRSALKRVADLKSQVKDIAATKAGKHIQLQEVERLLDQTRRELRFAQPYTECGKCKRKPERSCVACRGTGWVTESLYSSSHTEAEKAWIQNRK